MVPEVSSPPFSPEAETDFMGALLQDPSLIVGLGLETGDNPFFLESNQRLFEVLWDLYRKHKEVDSILVKDALGIDGVLSVGGTEYLESLWRTGNKGKGGGLWSIVRRKWVQRRIWDGAQKIQRAILEDQEE